ncbi:cation:proton antiporter domain-containing protein [Paracraurococcus lichenis]|uniref:Cation:proton antiporter n=1 Tax=Paracraurococcus lichenis TaxID=3064888 RepID=A0ABT9ECL0_9PROT|nr:cation:proton antiporter [Paracraurococcus sp. LOR1-02]MDO9713956.1 cation:proton antiporter [Paracraurococcus sp. LOR1-02]
MPERLHLPATRDGFVALGLGLLAYGLADLAEGYGVVAVFAAATTLRNLGSAPDFEQRLHNTTEQAERVAMVLVLAAFGAAIAGGLLAHIGWADGIFALLLFAVIRPAACLASFAGSAMPVTERFAIGLLGIRGLGSFFYVGYAVTHGLPAEWRDRL